MPELKKMSPEELKQILAEHKRLVETGCKEGKRADLRGTDLHGADFRGADLSGANLSATDLSGANLSGANLSRFDLTETQHKAEGTWLTNLSSANLAETNLTKANLRHADLSRTHLTLADLTGADLTGAILNTAQLHSTILTGANLLGAHLTEADLRQANFCEADLRGADLTESDLTGANLSKVNLRQANLNEANLNSADLTGADLSEAQLRDVKFDNATVTGCIFLGTNIYDASLINVTWGDSKEAWGGSFKIFRHKRRIVQDEVEAKNKSDFEDVAEIYRQLKIHYEDKRDFAEAGDFGYGQMEMKRKSMTGFTKAFCSFYKWFSGYGEMPGLAAVWLLSFLLLFPIAYMFNGITPRAPTPKLTKIHYNLSLALPGFWEAIDDFGGAFVHTLQVATIQKDKAYQSCNHPGRGLEILEVFLFPVQLTLLVLAMKRKFRR